MMRASEPPMKLRLFAESATISSCTFIGFSKSGMHLRAFESAPKKNLENDRMRSHEQCR
jgi:hypothetical protein